MPRPFFPHTLDDVTRAVDGPFGLVVGDMPGGEIFVLKRDRKAGTYTITHFRDATRSVVLGTEAIAERAAAIRRFCERIGLE